MLRLQWVSTLLSIYLLCIFKRFSSRTALRAAYEINKPLLTASNQQKKQQFKKININKNNNLWDKSKGLRCLDLPRASKNSLPRFSSKSIKISLYNDYKNCLMGEEKCLCEQRTGLQWCGKDGESIPGKGCWLHSCSRCLLAQVNSSVPVFSWHR